MMTPEDFNEMVDRATRSLDPGATPAMVAEAVLKRLTNAQAKDILTWALPAVIQHYWARERLATVRYTQGPSRAARNAATWRDAFLAQRIAIGERWLKMGEITHDDALELAADRRKRARELDAKAGQFTILASMLVEGDTVADLDAALVQKIFAA